MIGALIGDLAADTYNFHRDEFYINLVHKDAKLSDIGFAIFLMHELIKNNTPEDNWNLIFGHILDFYMTTQSNALNLDDNWRRWLTNNDGIPQNLKRILNYATDIVCGWKDVSAYYVRDWGCRFRGMKEEYYLAQISEIINRLRKGATKDEAIKGIHCIPNWVENGPRYNNENKESDLSPLSYASYAWLCFISSWDYTSAIHNAMKCPYGNKHILGALTGAFAEAMYGCKFSIIKEKYKKYGNTLFFIRISENVEKLFSRILDEMRIQDSVSRSFYPKNNALTNVERHSWYEVYNILSELEFTDEEYSWILKSAPTDHDQKYGFYLDNGWIYVYRSQYILGRFLMNKRDDKWRIEIVQLPENETYQRFLRAFFPAMHVGCGVFIQFKSNQIKYFESCKYFKGELTLPKKWENKEEGKFWHGEMMFIKSINDYSPWIEMAKNCIKDLTGAEKAQFESYPMENRVMLCYIETLFRKFCPMDNFDWILKY